MKMQMKLSSLFIMPIVLLFITHPAVFCQNGLNNKAQSKVDDPVQGTNGLKQTNDRPMEIIGKIEKAQGSIKTASYTLERTDTLVSGDTRILTGSAMIRMDKSDSLFGFEFEARRVGVHGESVYGGRIVYETDDSEKVYTVITDPSLLSHVLWEHSGQIILPDLVKLDTSGAIGFESWRDHRSIYLRLHYPDLTQYDVIRRSKTLTIDPVTLLPVAMRSHQETLGRVQDLYYRIKEIHVNDPSFQYDFSSPGFLAKYNQRIPQPARTLLSLKDIEAPAFTLSTFDDKKVSLADLRGKLVLLDFWEVWCGACIESMPKVQHLYDTYNGQGLQVFGVINEIKQLEPSKLLIKNRGISYPMLKGNEQLRKDYKLDAIPLLILIDRTGKVIFVSMGFSEELESVIKKAIAA
jgi:thiol-disulfide isomerase/thioredoxin